MDLSTDGASAFSERKQFSFSESRTLMAESRFIIKLIVSADGGFARALLGIWRNHQPCW